MNLILVPGLTEFITYPLESSYYTIVGLKYILSYQVPLNIPY